MYYQKFTLSRNATQHITLDVKLTMVTQHYAATSLLDIYCFEDLLNQMNHFSVI